MSNSSPDPGDQQKNPQQKNPLSIPPTHGGALANASAVSGGGLTLPNAGSMGELFSRAFAAEESLPGIARVMRDEAFVAALSQTSPFTTGDASQDAVEVRRCLQALQRLANPDAVRAAGNAVIGGVAELFARPDLFASAAGELAEHRNTRGEVLADYLSIVAAQIQQGARVFSDKSLWAVIDDKITRIINPSLAQELGKIVSATVVPESSVLTVYELLRTCAKTLEEQSLNTELRPLISLVASFSMERLAYALDLAPAVNVSESSQFSLKERLAVRLATDLGGEISQWGSTRRAPGMVMFYHAGGQGYAFLRSVFSGFFQLKSSVYRETPRNREDAARCQEVLQGYETLGACLGLLWPVETFAMLRERMTGLDPFQKAAALKVMKYTIGNDPEAATFTVTEAVRLLGHGDRRVFQTVASVLIDLVVPLAQWLSSNGGGIADGSTLIAQQRERLFERVFEPLAKENRLTSEIARLIEPFVMQLLERDGTEFLKVRPLLISFLAPSAISRLQTQQQYAITDIMMSAYGATSAATIDSGGLPNIDAHREAQYAELLSAMGLPAVMRAFAWANNRGLREVGAAGSLALRLVASAAAQKISAERAASYTAVERKGYAAMILRDLLPKLTELVHHKRMLLVGKSKQNQTAGGSATPQAGPEKADHGDDLSSLLKLGQRSAALEQSYLAALLMNPQFVCHLEELEGLAMRRAITAAVMPTNTCVDLLNYVGESDLQMIILQHEIMRLAGNTAKPVQATDNRIAGLVSALSSNTLRFGRAQQDEFNRLGTFLVREIEAGRFAYGESPELVKALRGVIAKPLQQGLYGIRTSSESGAEMGVGFALRVFAAYAATKQPMDDLAWRKLAAADKDRAKNDPSPQRILRAVIQAWFKGYPPADEHRSLMVMPRQIAQVMQAIIPHDADPVWVGQAIYLLSERVLLAVERYRGSSDDLRIHVEPLGEALSALERYVAPEFEAKDPHGETANVHEAVQRALAAVRSSLPREQVSGWHGTQERHVPQLPYRYQPGERIHIGGIDESALRLLG